ncbi:MAG: cell division protein FtsQ, partial [Haemophilus parahaemolyticus]|nr:cell division protein FtsQ [Haemophilus parahaemolyticus]
AWKDTVWLPKDQEVTLLVKFEHEANNELPFAFGVSDLMLRDRGAMGQFTVET